MRVISANAATAAVRVVADEVIPVRGLLHSDLINFVANLYHFQGRPPVPPNPGQLPVIPFQSGVAVINGERVPIQQLIIFADGDAVVAADTDLATLVMNDFIKNLDEGLGYRFHQAVLEWIFSSALTVEFDAKFVERPALFDVIQRAASKAVPQQGTRYRLKRISFGTDLGQEDRQLLFVSQFVASDFSIERRVAAPLEKNVFFSSAPLKTQDHIAYLEEIEREIIASNS